MEHTQSRQTLAVHLETLKRNLEAVPLEALKTKYKKPFDKLCQDISQTTSAHVKEITLKDIRIRADFFEEARPLIEKAIQNSGLLKQISHAAFRRQDLAEIDRLALELKKQILDALAPFYEKHVCLYLMPECFTDPPKQPEFYNKASGCIFRNGTWIPWEIEKEAVLMDTDETPINSPANSNAA